MLPGYAAGRTRNRVQTSALIYFVKTKMEVFTILMRFVLLHDPYILFTIVLYGTTPCSAKCHHVSIPPHRRHDPEAIRVSGCRCHRSLPLLQTPAPVFLYLAADDCQCPPGIWLGLCPD